MITTVTLNPAIDKTYWTARLLKGQVNRMNTVTALGFLGGYTGQFIEEYVEGIAAVCRKIFTQA